MPLQFGKSIERKSVIARKCAHGLAMTEYFKRKQAQILSNLCLSVEKGHQWQMPEDFYLAASFAAAILARSSGVIFQTKRNTTQLPRAQMAGKIRHSTLMPRMVPLLWTETETS